MAVQGSLNNTNVAFRRAGEGRMKDNETIEQDAGRSAALAQYTVMGQKASSRKWVPLTDVSPTLTPAKLVCGAAGTNLAGFQAVTDGEFAFTVDGVLINIIGLDWSAIAALDEVVDTINAQAAGRFTAIWDSKTAAVTFVSNSSGVLSTITVLSAVSGGSGTDVSGAGFLNGLTGTGTATQGTGGDGSDLPTGIYMGEDIAAADIVAGDVTARMILVGGNGIYDKNQVVLENSLALTDVVEARVQTIESVLQDRGIWLQDTLDISSHQA